MSSLGQKLQRVNRAKITRIPLSTNQPTPVRMVSTNHTNLEARLKTLTSAVSPYGLLRLSIMFAIRIVQNLSVMMLGVRMGLLCPI